ncbi:MAG TPA: hypothetical protein VFG64_01905 [Dongiaceae bacterium]|nr:hypothetical protein [Dongiaceae bacterium]
MPVFDFDLVFAGRQNGVQVEADFRKRLRFQCEIAQDAFNGVVRCVPLQTTSRADTGPRPCGQGPEK